MARKKAVKVVEEEQLRDYEMVVIVSPEVVDAFLLIGQGVDHPEEE